MRIDLNLRQLEAFVQVAACGSFRQAAARLGQSQPALSRFIRQAEQTLGARLFDRDTRRVEITAAVMVRHFQPGFRLRGVQP